MITVTERAAAGFDEMLKANNAPAGQGVKLVPTATGTIGMTIDTPSEGDEVIETGGKAVLIVDSRISGNLDGVIDCDTEEVDGQPQSRFKLLG
ncbi:MAG: hypothetical protein GEU73_01645 [Chloroflexi bacterium]|nr:hypothetical protein [Chloroflexota bacterium]